LRRELDKLKEQKTAKLEKKQLASMPSSQISNKRRDKNERRQAKHNTYDRGVGGSYQESASGTELTMDNQASFGEDVQAAQASSMN